MTELQYYAGMDTGGGEYSLEARARVGEGLLPTPMKGLS